MVSNDLRQKYYGDPKYDGTHMYYAWIRSYLTTTSKVLNIGAGPETNSPVRTLKGEVAEVVGIDIDPIVKENRELDRGLVIKNGLFPLEDQSFDIVFCDYVLEHVEHPTLFLSETRRVLKPGGRFFFRTPNLFHYVPLISMATPDWFHKAVANRVRMLPNETHEPWPTFYRMNTRSALQRLSEQAGFSQKEFRMIECEPSYLMFHTVPFYFGLAYERLVNSTQALAGMRVQILGQFQR